MLSTSRIYKYIKNTDDFFNITIFPSLLSTNNSAKQLAQDGATHGTVIIAEEQTGGRGRMGRSFFSPCSGGIYMSIILRPQQYIEKTMQITSKAAVAVARAIEIIPNIRAEIKWVNDIFVSGKKVCGILTEACFSPQSNELDFIVIGIGINVNTPKNTFPSEIEQIATSLIAHTNGEHICRSKLIAEILNELEIALQPTNENDILAEYKKRCFILGREINLISCNSTEYAVALDINDNYNLLVRDALGNIKAINSGEISIRTI